MTAAPKSSGRCRIAAAATPPLALPPFADESRARRVPIRDQPFGRGEVVVDRLLFGAADAGAMPVLSVLAASADPGQRIDAAELQPVQDEGLIPEKRDPPERAVAVHEGGAAAVAPEILPVREEHRDARSVRAPVENLLDRDLAAAEVDSLREKTEVSYFARSSR